MSDGAVNPSTPRATPRSGDMRALLLRAWLEPGIPPRLRARIVEITPGQDERPVIVTTSVDEACHTVRAWLEALRGRGASGEK
jgi:hypothetical protein